MEESIRDWYRELSLSLLDKPLPELIPIRYKTGEGRIFDNTFMSRDLKLRATGIDLTVNYVGDGTEPEAQLWDDYLTEITPLGNKPIIYTDPHSEGKSTTQHVFEIPVENKFDLEQVVNDYKLYKL